MQGQARKYTSIIHTFSRHVQYFKSWVIHGRMFLKLRSNGLFFFPSQIMHLKCIHFFKVLLLYSLLHSFFVKYSPSLSPHPTVSNCLCLFLNYHLFLTLHCLYHYTFSYSLLTISFVLSTLCFSVLLPGASDFV